MSNGLPSLLDAIFGKNDLGSVSMEEMNEVLREFPSFNAAHFLLSKKLKQENDAAYEKESQRTALYFNNPFWLQYVLNEGSNGTKDEVHISSEPENINRPDADTHMEEPHEEPAFVHVHTDIKTDPPAFAFQESAPFKMDDNPIVVEPVDVVEHKPEGAVTSFDELMAKYKIEESFEESIPETIPVPPEEIADQSNIFSQSSIELPPETTKDLQEQLENYEDILNEYGIFEEVVVKKNDRDMEAFDRPTEKASPPEENVPAELAGEEVHPVESRQMEIQSSIDEPIVENQHSESKQHSHRSDYEAFDKAKPRPVFNSKNAESIVFTPYHMVDYFASQGIKLVLEDNPPDAFGKQLKSFTDWLKVMKKQQPARLLSGNADEGESERIRHFAAHSIEERDILTESMAEVLAKQGMVENAIALYQKLSLIYPPKSAYFASRIEQLKAFLP